MASHGSLGSSRAGTQWITACGGGEANWKDHIPPSYSHIDCETMGANGFSSEWKRRKIWARVMVFWSINNVFHILKEKPEVRSPLVAILDQTVNLLGIVFKFLKSSCNLSLLKSLPYIFKARTSGFDGFDQFTVWYNKTVFNKKFRFVAH